jgi:hypothetical protein
MSVNGTLSSRLLSWFDRWSVLQGKPSAPGRDVLGQIAGRLRQVRHMRSCRNR